MHVRVCVCASLSASISPKLQSYLHQIFVHVTFVRVRPLLILTFGHVFDKLHSTFLSFWLLSLCFRVDYNR